VYTIAPRVAKGLDLLRLASDVVAIAVLDVALVVDHWKLLLNLMPYGGST